MVPDFYLVGDGKTGESAVIERTPRRLEVRRSTRTDGTILLANHALAPSFAADAENDRLKRYLTSGARYRRMEELVKHWRGQIDPKKALEILRDKRGAGNVELGLGNRNALDAIIATHSVVVDATSLTIWVSTGPHLLGKYVGYDLRKELLGQAEAEPPDLPDDPIAQSDEFRAVRAGPQRAGRGQSAQEARSGARARGGAPRRRARGEDAGAAPPHRRPVAGAGRPRRRSNRVPALPRAAPPYLKDIEDVKGILDTL